MPKSANQKKKLIILKSIFHEKTDPDHPISVQELIDELALHGIKAERKSIYQDIEALRELGEDIITVKRKTTGYCLASRDFELAELKLLIDAVGSSRFITQKKSNQLIEKLSRLASVHERKGLDRKIYVSDRTKTHNERIYYNVDKIHEAIGSGTSITFKYFGTNAKKERIYRRGGAYYTVSPRWLVWNESFYYLVGYDHVKGEIRHFRVDKMDGTELTGKKSEGLEALAKFDISSYVNGTFGMFTGEPETVTLECDNSLAGVIIDRFGADTVFLCDEETFRVTVKMTVSPVFLGWIIGFGGKIKILSPDSARAAISELAAKGAVYEY